MEREGESVLGEGEKKGEFSGFFRRPGNKKENLKKNEKKTLLLTVRQSHVHPDERGPGEHADGGGREREGEVGGHHRGVADEQDPEKSFFF